MDTNPPKPELISTDELIENVAVYVWNYACCLEKQGVNLNGSNMTQMLEDLRDSYITQVVIETHPETKGEVDE